MAAADPRVVAAAVVGGLADGGGDRWSDLDLTFAVADAVPVSEVLDDWTEEFRSRVRRGPPVRPSGWAFDLSSVSAAGAACRSTCRSRRRPRSARAVRGSGCSSVPRSTCLRLRRPRRTSCSDSACTTRSARVSASNAAAGGRPSTGSAASAIRPLRSPATASGLAVAEGRGFDDLPAEVLAPFEEALVRSLQPEELRRALASAVSGLSANRPRPLS